MHTHASCRQCFECFKPIVDFEVTFHNFHLCLSAYHHSSRIMHSLGKSGLKCSESTASVHGRLKRFFRLFHGQNLRLPQRSRSKFIQPLSFAIGYLKALISAPLPMVEPQLAYLSAICLGSDPNCFVKLTNSIPVL